MRDFVPTVDMTQPMSLLIVYDKATDVPTFALTNYGIGPNDADTVRLDQYTIPLYPYADNITYREVRPSGMGVGLHRREVSLDVRTGGPFATLPFSSALYSAGASTDTFYFGLYVTDFSLSLGNIRDVSTFLGYFDLDSGLGWDESSLSTTIRLVDRLTALTGRYGNRFEAAEPILAGSEWQPLLDAPAYLGYKPRVKAMGRVAARIGGFTTYDDSVRAVIAGIVQSSTLSGTSIQLGQSPTLAQLVGMSAKLKMGNGCVIVGTITDLGSGSYGINTTGLLINQAWDTILVYNKGWTAAGNQLSSVTTDLTSVFVDNTQSLAKLPSPNMYLRTPGNIELYNAGPQTSATPLFCKLTGIKDEANRELSCEPLKDPANPTWKYGGISVEFDAVQQSIAWTDPDNAHLNFAKWLGKQTCSLFFTDKTFILADIQKTGMPWELIVTPTINSSVTTDPVYYIKLAGTTTIAESATGQYAIYADNGTELTPIPNAEIDSITYNCNDFSMPDLCRIKLKRRLIDINEAYTEGEIYVDTWPPMYAGETIAYVMEEAGIGTNLRSFSLRTGTNELGNALTLEIGTETWSELLDSIVFESGLQIDTVGGFYNARSSFSKSTTHSFNNVAAPTQTFMYVDTDAAILFSDVISGSYKMDLGKAYTIIDSDKREYVRVHSTYRYKYSSYNGEKFRTLQSTKTMKDNDRKIDYTFKHTVDTNTAIAAAGQMGRIGHVACVADTTRLVEVGLPMSYMKLQVMDSVYLHDFKHITKVNDPLPAYDPNSSSNPVYTVGAFGAYAKYTTNVPFMLVPGVCIVDSLTINLSGEGVPITASFRQVQVNNVSNLKTVAERLDINTAAENTTPETTGGTNNPIVGEYYCPPGVYAPGQNKVIISPSSIKPSATAIADTCCNTTDTTGDVESDFNVTIICVGICETCGDGWPDGCLGAAKPMYYTAVTDNTIGNTDALEFDIMSGGSACPTLKSITVDGIADPVGVSYTPLCDGVNTYVGRLTVGPSIFASPENVYNKTVTLKYEVTTCFSKLPQTEGFKDRPLITLARPKEIIITIPISLRPVSDISLA